MVKWHQKYISWLWHGLKILKAKVNILDKCHWRMSVTLSYIVFGQRLCLGDQNGNHCSGVGHCGDLSKVSLLNLGVCKSFSRRAIWSSLLLTFWLICIMLCFGGSYFRSIPSLWFLFHLGIIELRQLKWTVWVWREWGELSPGTIDQRSVSRTMTLFPSGCRSSHQRDALYRKSYDVLYVCVYLYITWSFWGRRLYHYLSVGVYKMYWFCG